MRLCSPVIKTFVKGEGGVERYACNVKYIGGHNPDLVLSNAETGELIERVDLTRYKSAEELHAVFQSKGVGENTDAAPPPKSEL